MKGHIREGKVLCGICEGEIFVFRPARSRRTDGPRAQTLNEDFKLQFQARDEELDSGTIYCRSCDEILDPPQSIYLNGLWNDDPWD